MLLIEFYLGLGKFWVKLCFRFGNVFDLGLFWIWVFFEFITGAYSQFEYIFGLGMFSVWACYQFMLWVWLCFEIRCFWSVLGLGNFWV